jgi:hypothetical protein
MLEAPTMALLTRLIHPSFSRSEPATITKLSLLSSISSAYLFLALFSADCSADRERGREGEMEKDKKAALYHAKLEGAP